MNYKEITEFFQSRSVVFIRYINKYLIVPKSQKWLSITVVIIAIAIIQWTIKSFYVPEPKSLPRPTNDSFSAHPTAPNLGFGPQDAVVSASAKAVASAKAMEFNHISRLMRMFQPSFSKNSEIIGSADSGVIMHYSIDTLLSQTAARLLKNYHPKYGAIVVMESTTGRVLVLQSYTRDDVPSLGSHLYCRSIFPAASVFKTITAAAAIELTGFDESTLIKTCGPNYTLYLSQLKKDLPYSNEMSLGEAFTKSINPVFGRIGIYTLGSSNLAQYASKFGFNQPIPFELESESPIFIPSDSSYTIAELASGFNRTTLISPLFGALISSTVANNGKMPVPTIIDSATSCVDNRLLFARTPRTLRTAIKKSTSEHLVILMKSVVLRGTGRKSFRHLRPFQYFDEADIGGKTGNVNKEELGRVDWFVGFCRHKTNPALRIACGIVTTHDAYWTVHSSYLATEIFRTYLKTYDNLEKRNIDSTRYVAKYQSLMDTSESDSLDTE